MLPKPDACKGCPLYDDGLGWVPDEIVSGAEVDVWLQNPGDTEERKAKPAVGSTGDDLNEKFLPLAGLERGKDVNIRNVLRCRSRVPGTGEKTNKLPTGNTLRDAVSACRVHDAPTSAKVSVVCGALAWRLFEGPGKVTDWRGFPHPDKKVLCTLHPADLYRNPKMLHPVRMDWSKVPDFKAGIWPEETPTFEVVEHSSEASKVENWVDEALAKAPFVALDTEFSRSSDKYLVTLGCGYPGAPGLQIWFRHLNPVARSLIKTALIRLVMGVPIVFQNQMADVPVLERNLGIHYSMYKQIEDTMLSHAVLWSEWPHDLEYLASIYGRHQKMKHLSESNPKLYNWGDVIDTISIWQGVSKEFSYDALSRGVYRDQSLPLVPIILERAHKGIAVDRENVEKRAKELSVKRKAAVSLAHAAAGYPLNIGSEQQLKAYLYDYKGYPVQKDKEKKVSVGEDAISALRRLAGPEVDTDAEAKFGLQLDEVLVRVAKGADPVLESRVLYAGAKQEETHFLKPLMGVDRVYPNIKIHAQASGRWSITDPPLQQFPAHLQDLLVPDEGEVWIGWDWDQIELRILAALSNDTPYLDAFSQSWDVHMLNACDIFGLPWPNDRVQPEASWAAAHHWLGKKDIRRDFSKRFVYRLNYGGDPRMAGDIPGCKSLGLSGPDLVRASQRYLAAHPGMAAWRVRTAADARATGVSRTAFGRRRRFTSQGHAVEREAYNHPMQGTVSDILNLTTIQLKKEVPYGCLVYTVHDAAWWAVPESREAEAQKAFEPIIGQAWKIGGVDCSIPFKWKETRRALQVS